MSLPQSSGERVPQLLFELSEPGDARRRGVAGAVSLGLHALAILLAPVVFSALPQPDHAAETARLREAARLIAPLREFTQKEPTKCPISKEIDVESLRARLHSPAPAPPAPRRFEPPRSSSAAPPAPAALPEPPKIEALDPAGPQLAQGVLTPLPPPPPQAPVEKPKLAFEKPGAPSGVPQGTARLTPPSSSIDEIARGLARSRPGGGIIVGDIEGSPGGAGGIGGVQAPPRQGSTLELLSDPMGVDFRPYLLRILSTVRRNWQAVIPESVRYGQRGRVVIQFAIRKDGHVPKLVIAMSSGADALDRAAVAGISASNPFPPLPSEFKGDQIRVQFSFLYNMR